MELTALTSVICNKQEVNKIRKWATTITLHPLNGLFSRTT